MAKDSAIRFKLWPIRLNSGSVKVGRRVLKSPRSMRLIEVNIGLIGFKEWLNKAYTIKLSNTKKNKPTHINCLKPDQASRIEPAALEDTTKVP